MKKVLLFFLFFCAASAVFPQGQIPVEWLTQSPGNGFFLKTRTVAGRPGTAQWVPADSLPVSPGDGNGIYSGSGVVPASTTASLSSGIDLRLRSNTVSTLGRTNSGFTFEDSNRLINNGVSTFDAFPTFSLIGMSAIQKSTSDQGLIGFSPLAINPQLSRSSLSGFSSAGVTTNTLADSSFLILFSGLNYIRIGSNPNDTGTNTRLPARRPAANSFWRHNADGTGQYIDASTLGGQNFAVNNLTWDANRTHNANGFATTVQNSSLLNWSGQGTAYFRLLGSPTATIATQLEQATATDTAMVKLQANLGRADLKGTQSAHIDAPVVYLDQYAAGEVRTQADGLLVSQARPQLSKNAENTFVPTGMIDRAVVFSIEESTQGGFVGTDSTVVLPPGKYRVSYHVNYLLFPSVEGAMTFSVFLEFEGAPLDYTVHEGRKQSAADSPRLSGSSEIIYSVAGPGNEVLKLKQSATEGGNVNFFSANLYVEKLFD